MAMYSQGSAMWGRVPPRCIEMDSRKKKPPTSEELRHHIITMSAYIRVLVPDDLYLSVGWSGSVRKSHTVTAAAYHFAYISITKPL